MLYSIIPPALVVLSLVGIIVILVKKAPQVASLESRKTSEPKIFSNPSAAEIMKEKVDVLSEDKKMSGKKVSALFSVLAEKFKRSPERTKDAFGGVRDKLGRLRGPRKRNEIRSLELMEQDLTDETVEKLAAYEGAAVAKREEVIEVAVEDKETYSPEELTRPSFERVAKKEKSEAASKKDLFEKILIDRIAANPKDIEAYERLGEYYLEIENWEYAKECFKQVLKLNPRNIGARSRMRKLERILGK